jgi:hypothetical protein
VWSFPRLRKVTFKHATTLPKDGALLIAFLALHERLRKNPDALFRFPTDG